MERLSAKNKSRNQAERRKEGMDKARSLARESLNS